MVKKNRNLIKTFLTPIFLIFAIIVVRIFKNVRFGYNQVTRLGHFSNDLDIALVKLLKENRKRKTRLMIVTDGAVCNKYLRDLYLRVNTPNLKINFKTGAIYRLFFFYIQEHPRFKSLVIKTNNLCEENYELEGFDTLLHPTEEEVKLFEFWRQSHKGIRTDNPFIILHNRDSAWVPDLEYHDYRDFNPSVFVPIIKKYRNEYNFFRVGKVARTRLCNDYDNVIDMPFENCSEINDVLAHRHSLFFFGSDSGALNLSTSFRKPIAGICYPPTNYGAFRRINSYKLGFIPKKLVHRHSGKPVGLVEMYENKWINFLSSSQYNDAGLDLLVNTNQEISEFFDESLRIFKFSDCSFAQTPEQKEFWSIVEFYESDSGSSKKSVNSCFIGASYLRGNSYLFASS